MSRAGKRYNSRVFVSDDELLGLLLSKTTARLTWKQWHQQRVDNKLRIMQKKMQALQLEIMELQPQPKILQSIANSVHFNITAIFEYLLARNISHSNFAFFGSDPADNPQPIMWKFSFDNRNIFGNKNEGFFLQALSVRPSEPIACFNICCVRCIGTECDAQYGLHRNSL